MKRKAISLLLAMAMAFSAAAPAYAAVDSVAGDAVAAVTETPAAPQEQQAVLDELLTQTPDVDYVEHNVLVFTDSEAEAQSVADALGLALTDFYGYAALLTCPGTVAEAMRAALENPQELPTLYPDFIYSETPEAEEQAITVEPADSNTLTWDASTNDPYRWDQWYLNAINVDAAWDKGITGEGVYIAALDTGSNPMHEDLNVWRSWLSDRLPEKEDPVDKNGHGSRVAGVINMQPNNARGGVGIAYGATFDSIRVTNDKDEFTASLIMGGIYKAVYERVSVLTIGAVMNKDHYDYLQRGIEYAYDHGCVVIAPAGDYNQGVNFLPSHPHVIGVGAIKRDGTLYAAESGRKGYTDVRNIDIYAPGEYIWTTTLENNYVPVNGSAFAAAVVAGVAALCISADPELRAFAHDVDKLTVSPEQGRAFVEDVRDRLRNSVNSAGVVQVPGAINGANRSQIEAFVTRLYRVCLGREPDAAGLKNWTDHLLRGTMDGANVVYGFMIAPEFANKNYCNEHFVEYLYNAFFGRAPDEAGMQNWLDHMAGGMERERVLEGFAVSAEFTQLCNSYGITAVAPGKTEGNIVPRQTYGMVQRGPCAICGKKDNVTAFVERLYRECLNREGEADGIATWTDHLWSHRKNGREVVKGFALSDEMTLRGLSDEEFIEMLYRAMFGREYDAPGKAVWMDHMQREDWSREQVVDGFADCQEFTDLCRLYCITRG